MHIVYTYMYVPFVYMCVLHKFVKWVDQIWMKTTSIICGMARSVLNEFMTGVGVVWVRGISYGKISVSFIMVAEMLIVYN